MRAFLSFIALFAFCASLAAQEGSAKAKAALAVAAAQRERMHECKPGMSCWPQAKATLALAAAQR